jgi:hypothetical protein
MSGTVVYVTSNDPRPDGNAVLFVSVVRSTVTS